jgi:hypothetical protein
MYGLDSRDAVRLKAKVGDRVEKLGLRIPGTPGIQEDDHLEENIYLVGPSTNRIYVA